MPAGSTYTPIATTTLGSAQSTVTFSSISGSYSDLVLVTSVKDSNGACFLRFNNDSGTNYSRTWLTGNGSTASSNRQSNANQVYIIADATNFEMNITNIQNYSNSTTNKTALIRYGIANAEAAAAVYLWRSTAAINRIDIISTSGSATIASGSTFTLYGIASA